MKLVIFDFDGVIVNTFDMALKISTAINPDMTPEKYRSFFIGNFYSHDLKDEAEIDGKKIKYFDEYAKEIQSEKTEEIIKDQIVELSKKYTLAIVSSTISPVIKNYLVKEGLDSYFSEIYGSDVHKSKVEKIKRLLNEYNIDNKNAVFITDTSGDIKEGRECGVESIAVTWGYLPKEELVKEKPFAVIEDPVHIKIVVDKYFN
jgi:phosphoglycolate phosphatase